ncbi:uncharacterized protein LOC110986792 [Acanthaster planci]|uniref:Hydroxylysine kinase n=1 Tax=Acanthaster planci TaxID=133434 RepID=A0A8B7ZGB2_ACAPL|nr:uncharacterized protein LOC110986792 [Acanthaster planci]
MAQQASANGQLQLYPACLDNKGAKALVSKLYGWSVDHIKKLPGYDDLNFYIRSASTSSQHSEFVLKVMNSRDSGNRAWLEAQTDVLLHLTERGIHCSTPVKNLQGDYLSLEEIVDESGKQPAGLKFIVRMLMFLPGKMVRDLYQPNMAVPDKWFYVMGQNLGTMDKALLEFHEPSLAVLEKQASEYKWSPQCVPHVRDILWAVTDIDKRKLAEGILDEFEVQVVPKIGSLRRSVIHTDFNDMNIISLGNGPVPSKADWHTAGGPDIPAHQDSQLQALGAIDFSDIVCSSLVFDPADSHAYMMMSQLNGDPLVSGGHFLAGYNSVLPLTPTELGLIRCCTSGRLVQSLVNGLHAYSQDPSDEYVLDTQRTGWSVLEQLWSKSNDQLLSLWDRIADLYRPSVVKSPVLTHSEQDTDLMSKSGSTRKIKPSLSPTDVKGLLQQLYPIKTQHVEEIREFISYDDQNFHVRLGGGELAASMGGQEFVLKVINSEDSADKGAFDVQIAVLQFLKAKGFCCAAPVVNTNGKYLSLEEVCMSDKRTDPDNGNPQQTGVFLVFLQTYLPGQMMSTIELLPEQLCFDAGRKLAQMDQLLWDFPDPPDSFKGRAASNIWALESMPRVRDYMGEVKDQRRRELVESIVKSFEEEVVPQISSLRKCLIHSDFNDDNILVAEVYSGPDCEDADLLPLTKKRKRHPVYNITGVVDFSDFAYSCLVFEIASAMAMMLYSKAANPTAATGHLLAGFQSIIPLTAEELGLLYTCVMGKIGQELVLSLYNSRMQPRNPHVVFTQGQGWKYMEELWGDPGARAKVDKLWNDTAALYRT